MKHYKKLFLSFLKLDEIVNIIRKHKEILI